MPELPEVEVIRRELSSAAVPIRIVTSAARRRTRVELTRLPSLPTSLSV